MNAHVIEVIDSELDYAIAMWEFLPPEERPKSDKDKSVEFWILHMERYVQQARDGCYDTDKMPALEAVRKIATLAVRCMTYHETPKRR